MQIYVVEDQPHDVAQSLCDKHVLSHILETAELLAIAHVRNGESVPPMQELQARRRHLNHPFAKWVGHTISNYKWTEQLAKALCKEYTHRYNRQHAYEPDIDMMMHPPFKLSGKLEIILTPAPAVMPKIFVARSLVSSYRNYYCYKATKMYMNWTNRYPPAWLM